MRRMILVAAIASVLCATEGFAASFEILRSVDLNGAAPIYSVKYRENCKIGVEFYRNAATGNSMGLSRYAACPRPVEQLPQIVDAILDKAAQDHIRLSDYRTLYIGRAVDGPWRKRLINCYIAHYGLEARKMFPDAANLAFFDGCGVFRDLEASFARHDAVLRFDSVEKVIPIDLAKDDWKGDPDLSIVPDGKRHRGLIYGDSMLYFRIEPLRP